MIREVGSLVIAIVFVARLSAQGPSYVKDVRPFLDKYCIECHKTGLTKASVNLESYATLMKGGKNGKKIVLPGDPDKSTIVRCLDGAARKMPPKKYKNQPTKDEIEVVRKWVKAGATDDTPKKADARSAVQLPPEASRLVALDVPLTGPRGR